jgi:hypothetical protein
MNLRTEIRPQITKNTESLKVFDQHAGCTKWCEHEEQFLLLIFLCELCGKKLFLG